MSNHFTENEYDLILSDDITNNVEDFGTYDYDYAKMSVSNQNNQYIGSVVSGSVLPYGNFESQFETYINHIPDTCACPPTDLTTSMTSGTDEASCILITCVEALGMATWTPSQNIFYAAPSDVLNNSFNLFEQYLTDGNYNINYDFLNATATSGSTFIVDQISATRKEIRLLIRDNQDPPEIKSEGITGGWENFFKCTLGGIDTYNQLPGENACGTAACVCNDASTPTGLTDAPDSETCVAITCTDSSTPVWETAAQANYNFNFYAILPNAETMLIVNYGFDKVTNNTTSLVLRFQDALPSYVTRLDMFTVEEKRISTQEQQIYFHAQDISISTDGGLTVDSSYNINYTPDTAQNYEDIYTATNDSNIIEQIVSGGIDFNQNLNIDFNSWDNHVFFGSAMSKLDNFVTKAKEIEDYHAIISSSLQVTGSSTDITASSVDYGLIANRQTNFNKVKHVITTFTPFEKFLYNDGQSETTASAPGIGKNLAYATPVRLSGSLASILSSSYEGFDVVYKHSGSSDTGLTEEVVHLFSNVYKVEHPPFFNTDKPVYLSFLIKGSQDLTLTHTNINSTYDTADTSTGSYAAPPNWKVPVSALSKNTILSPTISTGSWNRYVFEASQSYWRPAGDTQDGSDGGYDIQNIDTWGSAGSGQFELLSGSNILSASVSGSFGDGFAYGIKDTSGQYGHLIQPSSMSAGGDFPMASVPVSGTVLPSGELFRISYDVSTLTALSTSLVTDITVTYNNPTSSLPFATVYSTGSGAWEDWYNVQSASAVVYDERNPHSLYNNLPKYMRDNAEYNALHSFINMIGEYYDVIRNYIDNYTTLHSRNYSNTKAVPDNLLPILAKNLGWEMINPYIGSLEDYFGNISATGDNLETIKNETWRKVLNNLMYIYKSKGTINSVNALLNTYGYPESFLKLKEHGGSLREHNPIVLNSIAEPFNIGLNRYTGSISFIAAMKLMPSLILKNSGSNYVKKLNLDWQTNNAKGDGIELIFRTSGNSNDPYAQTILESSGSNGQILWDVRLDCSSAPHSQLIFRLNKINNGNGAIASYNYTMSCSLEDYRNPSNKLYHAYITRDTITGSNAVTQSYILYTGLQDRDRIPLFSASYLQVTESTANANFYSTGSLSSAVSGNLYIGETFSGSIAEIRMWSGSLSASKFKQHILNKFSIVGNSANSWKNDRIWHYRLNENYHSGSSNDSYIINDSSIGGVDYSRVTGYWQYAIDWVNAYKFTTRLGGTTENINKVIISTNDIYTNGRQLNPKKSIIKSEFNKDRKLAKTSIKIEISHNPNTLIEDYITNTIPDYNLGNVIKPNEVYQDTYEDLKALRKDVMEGVSIDINKNIKANKNRINTNIIKQTKSILPVRSTIDNIGIIIRSDTLHRNKYKNIAPEYELLGHTGVIEDIIPEAVGDIVDEHLLPLTTGLQVSSSYSPLKIGTIDMTEQLVFSNTYQSTYDVEVTEPSTLSVIYDKSNDGILPISASTIAEYFKIYSDSIDVISTNAEYVNTHDITIGNPIIESGVYLNSHNSVIDDIINTSAEYVTSYNYEFGDILTEYGTYIPTRNVIISDLVSNSAEYITSYDKTITDIIKNSAEYINVYSKVIDNIVTDPVLELQLVNEFTFSDLQQAAGEYLNVYTKNISNFISQSAEYLTAYAKTISYPISTDIEYLAPYNTNIDILPVKSADYLAEYSFLISSSLVESMELFKTYDTRLSLPITQHIEYLKMYADTINIDIQKSSEYLQAYTDVIDMRPTTLTDYLSSYDYEFKNPLNESAEYLQTYTDVIDMRPTTSIDYLLSYDYEFKNPLNESAEYLQTYTDVINMRPTTSIDHLSSYDYEFKNPVNESAEYLPIRGTNINQPISESVYYIKPYDDIIDIPINSSAEKMNVYTKNISNFITESADYIINYNYEFNNIISSSGYHISTYNLDLTLPHTSIAEYVKLYDYTLDIPINSSAEKMNVYTKNISNFITESADYIINYNYEFNNIISSSGNYISTYNLGLTLPHTSIAEYVKLYDYTLDIPINSSAEKMNVYTKTLSGFVTTTANYITTYNYKFSEVMSSSGNYISIYNLDLTLPHTSIAEYIKLYDDVIDVKQYVTASLQDVLSVAITSIPDTISTEYLKVLDSTIISPTITAVEYIASLDNIINAIPSQSASYIASLDDIINAIPGQSASYIPTRDGLIDYLRKNHTKTFRDTWKESKWGSPHIKIEETSGSLEWMQPHWKRRHYTSQSLSESIAAGSPRGPNTSTWHHETRCVFKTIGDLESTSGSLLGDTGWVEPDHTNFNHFFNTLMSIKHPSFHIEQEKTYTYQSYYPLGTTSASVGAPRDGYLTGRPVGHTAYYATGSDGTLYYPRNHYIYQNTTKKDCPKGIGYEGTQNVKPGFWGNLIMSPSGQIEIDDHGDLSEEAFYSIKVEDGNKLKVFNPNDKK